VSSAAHANLAGAARAWLESREWMDFLHPDSPAFAHKLAERALIIDAWGPALEGAGTVLDLGGGIGRFAMPCLDAGASVHLVDADPEALACAAQHAAGRPGTLTRWEADANTLPNAIPTCEAAIAAELLCYVEDPAAVLAGLRRHLVPGAPLCFSVEARWGWAMAVDAPPGGLDALFGDGVVHVPGDRFVRTFEEADVRALFADWTLERLVPTHFVFGGPLQQVAGPLTPSALLHWEAAARAHPIFGRLNRAWTGVARA
jgi:SAM-dependent methyltransferase